MSAAKPEGGWGLNAGAFMAYYRDWVIRGTGTGWTAQHRGAGGRSRGPVLEARSLDNLAALIEQDGAPGQ